MRGAVMHRGDQCRAQRGVAAVGAGEEVVPRPGSEVGIVLAAAKVAFGRLFRGFGHRRSSYGGRIALANEYSITNIGRAAFDALERPAMTLSAWGACGWQRMAAPLRHYVLFAVREQGL